MRLIFKHWKEAKEKLKMKWATRKEMASKSIQLIDKYDSCLAFAASKNHFNWRLSERLFLCVGWEKSWLEEERKKRKFWLRRKKKKM